MNDRELLELAAKAAGYWLADDGMCATDVATPFVRWDPLADDGDALRLASAIGLMVNFHTGSVYARNNGSRCPHIVNRDNIRRAIVRVAAEVGKAM